MLGTLNEPLRWSARVGLIATHSEASRLPLGNHRRIAFRRIATAFLLVRLKIVEFKLDGIADEIENRPAIKPAKSRSGARKVADVGTHEVEIEARNTHLTDSFESASVVEFTSLASMKRRTSERR
jgi:hypothetical protein